MRLPTKALVLGAAAALILAGCSSGSDDSADDRVEVFTWWSTGSEALGLDAMVKVFDEQHPDIKFVNGAVAGGGGSAKNLLQDRLAAGDPPDSFQAHAGKEIQDYIEAGQVQDVSNLYDEFELRDAFPQDLVDLLTSDGKIYSIPSNIHRANVLWASVPVLEQAGLSTDVSFASMDDFIAALDQVKQNVPDVTPLSIGTTWTQVHLLEVVLIAELGPEAYVGLWDGTTDWKSSKVTDALTTFQTLMSYTNTDRDGLDWEEPHTMLIDGKAAFNIMGDWAPANYDSRDQVDGTDYVYAPAPGTDGVFDFLADSFTLTTKAPHPDSAKAWLETISSKDGQVAFNKIKGSIPARTDIDSAEFSTYQQTAITAFADDTIVPSLQHGAAATIKQLNDITAATSKFTTGGSNLSTFQSELADAMD
ncbi:MAG: ABC transporter substrate-binding protein [Cellulomonas sp.]|jgi:glucose/mannose transport system substrate-binding protein|nr:ABC transporter substrate-binding protein [Cellulomonas sp.]